MSNIFDPQNKILHNLDYVKDLITTNYSAPILVEVDPSNTCNHGCYFCISSYIHLPESKNLETYDKSIMSQKMLLSLAKDLIATKTKAINWTGGGEPTVNPHLGKTIEFIKQNSNIKMGMFTNGSLLHKNDLFKIVVKSLDWIRISIDAGEPAIYNNIRRTTTANNWDKVLANLNRLIEVKKEYNSFIDIGVGFVVTPDNKDEIIAFAKAFKDFNIQYCQYKPEIVNKERSDGIQHNLEFWKEIEPSLNIAKEILKEKFQLNSYKLEDLRDNSETYGRTYKKCLGSQVSPCIGADGEVYVCTNHRGYKEYSYGSLYDRSFIDIWQDIEKKQAILKQIEDKECFSKCTKLCKPHESNKMLWHIYKEHKTYGDTIWDTLEQLKDNNIKHKEFI